MTERVLTARDLNRALLARQLLLERSALSIPAALEALAGVQNQYAPNAYLRLWSCVEGFRRDDLTRAYQSGAAVQGTLMRGTIHTVSARDYRAFAAAVREAQRRWARSVHGDDSDRAAVVRRVRAALAGRSVGRRELDELRGTASAAAWATLDTDAELIRVPPSGTWERRRADRWALADDRIRPRPAVDRERAIGHIVRRYLRGFGPARLRDVASFTGIPAATLAPVVERLRLRRFRDEAGGVLLDVPGAPLPGADTPAPVRFLPTWDATLLVHARRTGILPERHRPVVFTTKMPASYPTFLVDGTVAGTWRYADGAVSVTAFEPLPRRVEHEVEAEAERLAAFHEG